MPFPHCIAAALADQLITADDAEIYNRTYDEELHARSASMTPHEAAAEAARATFAAIEGDAAETRRQAFLALSARADIVKRLDEYRSHWNGRADPFEAAQGLYDRLLPNRKGLAAEQQHEFWKGEAHRHLDEAFITWRRNLVGVRRNRPRAINVVKERFGEASGDVAAKALSHGFGKASATLRQAFNRFGGHIGELEDWGLPQVWHRDRVARVPFAEWRADVLAELDRARVRTRNGARPLNDAELDEALQGVHQNIMTQSWAGKEATGGGGRAMANRHAEHRFLHFKDADGWLRLQQKYGEGDPIDAMLGHVDRMSRDAGLMQVMGPNPTASLAWLKNELKRRAALAPDGGRAALRDDAVHAGDKLDALHINYTRSNSAPTRPIVAEAIYDVQNTLMSAQLGSAVIPAVFGDSSTQRLARATRGLPEVKMIKSYFDQLRSIDNRMAAIRAGLTAQHYAQVLGSQGRWTGELFGHPWSRWLNDRVQAATGLTAWTAAGRSAFGLDFYGHVADMQHTAWGDLHPDFRSTLEGFGFDAADWGHIQTTAPYQHGGANFVRPGDIFERSDLDHSTALALASKLADAAMTGQEHAVPSNSLAARALLRGIDRPGTPSAVLKGSVAMYHTFGSTLLLTHGRRMIELGRTNPLRAASYTAGLVFTTMLAGAMSIQAKEVAQGRDPKDMTDWRFWLAALAQGGGTGILGDFVYASIQGSGRTGAGLTTVLAGPLAGFVADLSTTALGYDPMAPDPVNRSMAQQNFGTRLLNFAKRNIPGGNIWYSRLVLERLVWDHIQELIDPGWQHRVHQQERNYRKTFGSGFWWQRGENLPSRAPDPGTAIGNP